MIFTTISNLLMLLDFITYLYNCREIHDGALFIMERSEPPLCEDCIVNLSVIHLILECPSFSVKRSRYLGHGPYTLRVYIDWK